MMENNLLSSKEIIFFETNGYLVLEPGRVFSNEQINQLKIECDSYFPNYDSGAVNQTEEQRKKNSKLGINGNVKNFIFNSKENSILKKNPLFGKRATLIAPKFSQNFVNAIENENLLSVNRQLLNSSELSLHNSAIACVYPGSVGEPGNFHADTSGFSDEPLKAVKSGKFMINSFIYLVDVNEENAPIRVLPQSHNKYIELNELVAPSFHSTKEVNNIGQFNFYDEFVPETYPKPISVTGKAGSIVLLSGNLLHSATRNCAKDKIRYTLAIWFSARKDKEFYKDYSSFSAFCEDFIHKFKDKNIPYWTYYISSISFQFKAKKLIKKLTVGVFNRIKKQMKNFFGKKQSKPFRQFGNIFLSNQQGDSSSNSILYLDHLTHPKDEAPLRLRDLLKNEKNVSELYLVAPNAESFLNMYHRKDYTFFEKLPLKQYFYDESWTRYIVRYFSNIISSFASEEQCKSCMASSSVNFFDKLASLENELVKNIVNSAEIEGDIPKSRWTEESLQTLLVSSNLVLEKVNAFDREQISSVLGGTPDAWLVVKGSLK